MRVTPPYIRHFSPGRAVTRNPSAGAYALRLPSGGGVAFQRFQSVTPDAPATAAAVAGGFSSRLIATRRHASPCNATRHDSTLLLAPQRYSPLSADRSGR